MHQKNSDDPMVMFFINMAIGLFVIGAAWYYGARYLLPDQQQLNTVSLQEVWLYRYNLGAYFAWLCPRMIADGYPETFTVAVLPGVLVYAGMIWLRGGTWLSLIDAFIGWVAGAAAGYGVMTWVPLPNPLFQTFVMPVMAFLGGGLLAVFRAPPKENAPLRGTHIKVAKRIKSAVVIRKALKAGATVLAGVLLQFTAEVEHIIVLGTTGSGKTVALRITMFTALMRGDRHIVADPDGSAMSLFYQDGDVILNPFDARSVKWDILVEIEEETDYRLLAEAVVALLREDRSDQWVKFAQEVVAACLRTWHRHQLGSSDAFFDAMATADTEKLAQLCEGTAAHRYFESGNQKMLGSILGTMAPPLANMQQLANLQGPPFSIRRWIKEGKGSLWMPYQAKQIPALRLLISCWTGLAISETLSLPESRQRRMWFHVDELDALGPIQRLKDSLARLRKIGGCVVLGVQSIAQVRAVYGAADANTIVENCNNKLILRCGASEGGGTAQFASELIGDRVVERDETTTSRSEGQNTRVSTSYSVREHREPAVLASEIMQLDPCSGYLKTVTQKHWLKVAYNPVDFPARVPPFVPIEQPMHDTDE